MVFRADLVMMVEVSTMGLVEECGGCITITAWLSNGGFQSGGKGVCGRRRVLVVEEENKVP